MKREDNGQKKELGKKHVCLLLRLMSNDVFILRPQEVQQGRLVFNVVIKKNQP